MTVETSQSCCAFSDELISSECEQMNSVVCLLVACSVCLVCFTLSQVVKAGRQVEEQPASLAVDKQC